MLLWSDLSLIPWQLVSRDETENVLAVGRVALPAPWLSQEEVVAASHCGAMLAEASRETLPFFAPFGGRIWPIIEAPDSESTASSYSHDRGDWVAQHIVLPALRQHLEMLPRLDMADEAAAIAFADEVLRVARDERLRYLIVVPMSGVDLDAATGRRN